MSEITPDPIATPPEQAPGGAPAVPPEASPPPRSRRLKPGTRLVITLAGGYLALGLVFSALLVAWTMRAERASLVGEVGNRGEAVAQLFVLSIGESLYAFDVESLIEWIRYLVALEDIERVLIFDAKGRTITDGRKENPHLGEILPGSLDAVKAKENAPAVTTGDDRLSIRVPVRLHDRTLGGVQIDLSLFAVERQLERSQRRMWQQMILLLLLGLVPVWGLTNYLIRPFFVGA